MAHQLGFICVVTNAFEQSHFWEVNSSLASNEIPHILWKTGSLSFFFLNSWFRASWFNVNKKVQLDATICRHLFTSRSLYMFRVSQHPSSGALKTVTAAWSRLQSWSGHVGRKWPYQHYDLYQRQRLQFLVLLMMGAVTPETCRVTMQ